MTYAPWAGIASYRSNFGSIYASTTDPQRALALAWEEVRALQRDLVADKELSGLVAQEETALFSRCESPRSHAEALIHAELVGGRWRGFYQLPEALGRVTPGEVREAARTYLRRFRFGLVGPAKLERADVAPFWEE